MHADRRRILMTDNWLHDRFESSAMAKPRLVFSAIVCLWAVHVLIQGFA